MSTPADLAPRPPRRGGRPFAAMLWSLLPVVAVLVLLVWWQRGAPTPVQSVDPAPDVAYARRVSPVPLPAPGPLPGNWRATSSRVDAPAGEARRSPVTLTIGYLTGDDKFAEVVIGDRPAAALLVDAAPHATAEGTVLVGPGRWNAYRDQRGEQVLATTVGTAGVVVTGDASGTDLATLAGAVVPARAGG